MEGLTKRGLALFASLAIAGAYVHLAPLPARRPKTERWMEQKLPTQIGDYRFAPSKDNPAQSYRMDQSTYDTLKPFGIVCRDYTDGKKTFDVVVIASDNRASFHDPRVCFTAQGFTINQETRASFPSPIGNIPYTAVDMGSSDGDMSAMYFYKGPGGYYADTQHLKFGLFLDNLRGATKPEGVFYRIIPDYKGATAADLQAFAGQMKAACTASSGGYF